MSFEFSILVKIIPDFQLKLSVGKPRFYLPCQVQLRLLNFPTRRQRRTQRAQIQGVTAGGEINSIGDRPDQPHESTEAIAKQPPRRISRHNASFGFFPYQNYIGRRRLQTSEQILLRSSPNCRFLFQKIRRPSSQRINQKAIRRLA